MAMATVNIHEAKSTLSKLIADIESGREEEIVIARNGRPAARLTALEDSARQPLRFGLAKGKFRLPDNFDADNEAIARLFYGEDEGEAAR